MQNKWAWAPDDGQVFIYCQANFVAQLNVAFETMLIWAVLAGISSQTLKPNLICNKLSAEQVEQLKSHFILRDIRLQYLINW